MKLGPLGKVGRFRLQSMESSAAFVPWLVVGMMVSSKAVRSKILTAEVDEFTTDLNRRKIKEVPNALYLARSESPVQPDHRILKHVISLLPAPKSWLSVEHAASEGKETVTGVVNK